MRTICVCYLICIVLAINVTSVSAWEFSMKAEGETRYRYISRTGPNDLFGNADDAARQPMRFPVTDYLNTSIGLAGAHHRYVQVEGYSSKGSDAAWAEQRFDIYPVIRVNKAISVKAIISLLHGNLNGSYGRIYAPDFDSSIPRSVPTGFARSVIRQSENWGTNPHHTGWNMIDSRDIVSGVGMAVPVINALWYTVRTPWGTLVYGRRPAGFGPGWVLHRDDVYARSISLIVPYGPLTFAFSQYLHDTGEDSDPNNEFNAFKFNLDLTGIWPFTSPGSVDKNKSMDWNQSFAVVYRSAGYDIGLLARVVRWNNVHSVPYIVTNPAPPPNNVLSGTIRDDVLGSGSLGGHSAGGTRTSVFLGGTRGFGDPRPIYGDMFFLLGIAYLKYQSSRFFLNSEYDFQLIEVRRQGGRPISGFPQAWMVETGLLSGPMKFSLAHFYRSGHDRRRGWFNTIWPNGSILTYDKWELFLPAWGGGQAPIEPYTFLMRLYGTGNNSFNSAGKCTFTDFLAYGARLDYALAANLNLYATILHAQRASNTGMPATGSFGGYEYAESDYAIYPGFIVGRWPNVPDNDLGLEIGVGLQWQLLENFEFKLRFAHWQPGNWFKWAYADHSRRPFLGKGPNPGRTIDPLIGIESSLLVEF